MLLELLENKQKVLVLVLLMQYNARSFPAIQVMASTLECLVRIHNKHEQQQAQDGLSSTHICLLLVRRTNQ